MAKKVSQAKNDGEVIIGTLQKNVIESYIMANSKHKLSIYGERLLLKLVEIAQSEVYGLDFKGGEGLKRVNADSLSTIVEINIKDLLGEGSNYHKAKVAVQELLHVHHEHEEPILNGQVQVYDEYGKPMYKYEAHQLFNDVYVNAKPGTIIVEVNRHTWRALVDFSKGFRRYDLLLAMRLTRDLSLRLYKLVSEQKTPMSYTISELKEMFGVEDKYPQTKDFIHLLESAKEELDVVSPWTFILEKKYNMSSEANTGRVGRKAITSVVIHPIHQLKNEAQNSNSLRVSPSMLLGKEIVDKLEQYFGFSRSEIESNESLFYACKKNFGQNDDSPDLFDFLTKIAPGANRAANVQGYVINALKKHLEEKYKITVLNGKVIQKKDNDDIAAKLLANAFKPDYK